LRGRWGPEVLVRKAVCAVCVRVVVLRCRSLRTRLRLGLGSRRRWTIVLPAIGRTCVGIARRRWRWTASRCVRRVVRWYVQISKLLSFCVVLGTLKGVAQDLVRSLDLLELGDPFLLVARVSVGVALECELAERLADIVVAGVGGDA
jgi:hypothetical protein